MRTVNLPAFNYKEWIFISVRVLLNLMMKWNNKKKIGCNKFPILFPTQFKYQLMHFYDVQKKRFHITYTPNRCNLYNSCWFWPRWDLKPAVKEKIDAAALVFFFFLKSTASQHWLLREYEIVATFFGLWMRPQSSHTKFLVPSPQPNSPTRIVSRLSSRMWISMADGKPDKIANCIVTSCGFSP